MDLNRIVDKLIRDAQAEGKFDNLPGLGRPLKLDDASEDSEWWTANHLLKNSGFRPAWLEEDLAIRNDLDRARAALKRTRDWRQAELAALGQRRDLEAQRRRDWADGEWALAQARFREAAAQINRRLRSLNLKVPGERFQRLLVEVEAEIQKVMSV